MGARIAPRRRPRPGRAAQCRRGKTGGGNARGDWGRGDVWEDQEAEDEGGDGGESGDLFGLGWEETAVEEVVWDLVRER